MFQLATDAVWRNRLESINSEVEHIRLPNSVDGVDQDEEWCEVVVNGCPQLRYQLTQAYFARQRP